MVHRVSNESPGYFLVPGAKVNLTEIPVFNKTGITGSFDIEIPGLPVRGGADGAIRAVRNALGLDLESHHGTAESLIVDHVEKPSQN